MRKKIYRMVHVYDENKISIAYKWFMIAVIMISLIPLTVRQTNGIFRIIDIFCLVVYIIDYVLRWISADYKFQKFSPVSFARYPFRFISIIDLLSVLALLCPLVGWFKYSSFTKVLKVFRIVRIFRYSKVVKHITTVLNECKKPLIAVGALAIGYIVVTALIMFNVEPNTFKTFLDAIYWSVQSLTTVGYGDICPVTSIGKTIATLSSFFGIAVVALPAGVVTAEYMKSVNTKE